MKAFAQYSIWRGEITYVGLGPTKRNRKAKVRKYQNEAEHVPSLRKNQRACVSSRWRVRKKLGVRARRDDRTLCVYVVGIGIIRTAISARSWHKSIRPSAPN